MSDQDTFFGVESDTNQTYTPPVNSQPADSLQELKFGDSNQYTSDYVQPVAPQQEETVLQFQETNIPTYTSGAMASQDQRGSGSENRQGGGNGQSSNEGGGGGWGGFINNILTLSFFHQYFDVNTEDVLARLLSSVVGFFQSSFYDKTLDNPDLYGPIWVCATLVFVTAASGNLANYLDHIKTSSQKEGDTEAWFYDIGKVVQSVALFYGYTFIGGLIIWGVCKYGQVQAGLVHLWCIFGYAIAVYIPVSMLCVIPNTLVAWILVVVSTLTSGIFLLVNLRQPVIKSLTGTLSTVIMIGLVVAHLGLGLALKLQFFSYGAGGDSKGGGGSSSGKGEAGGGGGKSLLGIDLFS